MANLTKEQRLVREKEKQEQINAELQEKLNTQQEEFSAMIQAQKEMFEKQLAEMKQSVEANKDLSQNTIRAKEIQKSKKIPLDTVVPVIGNTVGGEIYKSKKMVGYMVEWDEYGSEEFMELSELVAMRNTDRRFFTDNWIILEDTDEYSAFELYDFLKVTKFYENILTPANIDKLFNMDNEAIIKIISGMSKGMKSTIASKVQQKIVSGELDSTSKIDAFEDALNVKFSI
jgi:hypothetical protein